jgi:chromosomal replication initiator protein
VLASETAENIWSGVLERLKPQLKDEIFNLWVKPLKAQQWDSDLLTLQVPNRFFSEWVKKNCQRQIEDALKKFWAGTQRLGFETGLEIEPILEREEVRAEPIASPKTENHFTGEQFNPKYTFESFVVGPSNRFAQAAAMAVAKDPGPGVQPVVSLRGRRPW